METKGLASLIDLILLVLEITSLVIYWQPIRSPHIDKQRSDP